MNIKNLLPNWGKIEMVSPAEFPHLERSCAPVRTKLRNAASPCPVPQGGQSQLLSHQRTQSTQHTPSMPLKQPPLHEFQLLVYLSSYFTGLVKKALLYIKILLRILSVKVVNFLCR